MDYNRNLSELAAVLDQIIPSSQAASTVLSGAIDTKLHRRLLAIVQVGALGASATVSAKFVAAPTAGGAYVDVTGTTITTLTTTGTRVALIELKSETLEALGLGRFVKLSLTVGVAATGTSAVILGSDERYEPASDYSNAAVAQILVA